MHASASDAAERLVDTAGLPSNEALERSGAVIGRIHIDHRDVFDLTDPKENRALYRLANRLHARTKRNVIAERLLFKSGDPFSSRLLEESERLLRGERFLGEARIRATRVVDGKVDIDVCTRDVWSFNPGISYGRGGGKNRVGFELQEINLLGTGIELSLDHERNVDRTTDAIKLKDKHAFGGRNTLELGYSNNSDGSSWRVGFERPFYALDSRWAAGAHIEEIAQVDSLYQLGEIFERYKTEGRDAEIYGGYSTGLRDGWVRRWSVGATQYQRAFLPATDTRGTGLLPADRDFVYPWLGFEMLQDNYDVWENRNQIGRREDVLLGTRVSARLGYAASSFGSDRSALLYQASLSHGFVPAADDTLLLETSISGRRESGRDANLRWDSSARYFHQQSDNSLFFAKMQGSWGRNLDLDDTYLLGGDNGLRGYPLRYQGGDRRALLTLEQRYFTDWYPFRLFRVGAAAFFDIGRTWGYDGLGTPNYGLLKDVGVGLRLGNTRSSLGNVIHIDLAFPLDGPNTIDNVQLLIEARSEF